jgi:hypothetical protein
MQRINPAPGRNPEPARSPAPTRNSVPSRDRKGAVAALAALTLLFALSLPAQSPTAIRGYAFDADGRPIPGASVTLHGSTGHSSATSAADGSFHFDNVSPGHYQVYAIDEKREIVSDVSVVLDLAAGQTAEADVTVATSTHHYPRWLRILRRLDGMSH